MHLCARPAHLESRREGRWQTSKRVSPSGAISHYPKVNTECWTTAVGAKIKRRLLALCYRHDARKEQTVWEELAQLQARETNVRSKQPSNSSPAHVECSRSNQRDETDDWEAAVHSGSSNPYGSALCKRSKTSIAGNIDLRPNGTAKCSLWILIGHRLYAKPRTGPVLGRVLSTWRCGRPAGQASSSPRRD